MSDLRPNLQTAVKLASIAVHAGELVSPSGHHFDVSTIKSLLADPEVVAYLNTLRPLALLPVVRASEGTPDE